MLFLVKMPNGVVVEERYAGSLIRVQGLLSRAISTSPPSVEALTALTSNELVKFPHQINLKVINATRGGKTSLAQFIHNHWDTYISRLFEIDRSITLTLKGMPVSAFLWRMAFGTFPIIIRGGQVFHISVLNDYRKELDEAMLKTLTIEQLQSCLRRVFNNYTLVKKKDILMEKIVECYGLMTEVNSRQLHHEEADENPEVVEESESESNEETESESEGGTSTQEAFTVKTQKVYVNVIGFTDRFEFDINPKMMPVADFKELIVEKNSRDFDEPITVTDFYLCIDGKIADDYPRVQEYVEGGKTTFDLLLRVRGGGFGKKRRVVVSELQAKDEDNHHIKSLFEMKTFNERDFIDKMGSEELQDYLKCLESVQSKPNQIKAAMDKIANYATVKAELLKS